ncbi:MAG: hypothetical protein DCC71_13670 [Proteobacteria bacterium]|nr:MAG: hypothetical protein DCC71_13670 [Pseudomonadota bacterium]
MADSVSLRQRSCMPGISARSSAPSQPLPSVSASERPVYRNHHSFTKVTRPAAFTRHTIAGSWLASLRKRRSLSRSAWSAARRSVMSWLMPTMRYGPASSKSTSARACSQRVEPSGRTMR